MKTFGALADKRVRGDRMLSFVLLRWFRFTVLSHHIYCCIQGEIYSTTSQSGKRVRYWCSWNVRGYLGRMGIKGFLERLDGVKVQVAYCNVGRQ